MAPFRILSLDGGGIRGVLTATLLERLEQDHPGFMGMVDLYAGTSTGGILALGLASGLTPTKARELYEKLGSKVFQDSLIDNIIDLGNFRGSQYSNKPLKEQLVEQFGNMTLKELPKKVIISSFDLDNKPTDPSKPRFWKPKYFHNFPGESSDCDEKVVDVALRTSAAPTFFPIYQGYIDGGVISNNPSMCALAQAIEPQTGRQKLRDIRIISLGTGYNPRYLTEQDENWGLLQWAPNLISLMLEGSVGLADYQCRQVLSDRYLRIDPILPIPISLDGVKQISVMKDIAYQFDLGTARAWLKRNFRLKKIKIP